MRVLFCNIAWMKYYKGTYDDDIPVNGGSYVKDNQSASEDMNFLPIADENGDFACYGSVETKTGAGRHKPNELHIEKLEGCELLKNEEFADDVLVIFCAKPDRPDTWHCVVGWYRHARVYRNYQTIRVTTPEEEFDFSYNIEALKEDVTLLPSGIRQRKTLWWIPRANKQGYGFGQANVWFPTDIKSEAGKNYLSALLKRIEEYDGENWVDYYG